MSQPLLPALIGAALVALSLGACQAQVAGTVAPGVSPAPTTTATASPAAALAINGRWLTGGAGDAEPTGPYIAPLQCPEGGNAMPRASIPRDLANRVWQVTQAGDDVTIASLYDEAYGPTGPRPNCPSRTTTAKGTYRNGSLSLTGTYNADVKPCDGYGVQSPWPIPASTSEAVTWDLKLDPATGHLRGTRNGKPFWAAPVQEAPAGGATPCPPMAVA